MWEMNSNAVRAKWAEVLDFVRTAGGVVLVSKWNKETAAVVPADWYREAVEAIGPPKPPQAPTGPPSTTG